MASGSRQAWQQSPWQRRELVQTIGAMSDGLAELKRRIAAEHLGNPEIGQGLRGRQFGAALSHERHADGIGVGH
jgi:hypothetical protein